MISCVQNTIPNIIGTLYSQSPQIIQTKNFHKQNHLISSSLAICCKQWQLADLLLKRLDCLVHVGNSCHVYIVQASTGCCVERPDMIVSMARRRSTTWRATTGGAYIRIMSSRATL